ncbi:MAG: hypothetical protein ACRDNS_09395, partial [Trebonia sp.]
MEPTEAEGRAMYGMILAELRRYVDAHVGADVWFALTKELGMSPLYVAGKEYPDSEATKLIA